MDHFYESQYPPDIAVEASIVQFFESFSRISDTSGAHDAYVDMFTDDATFILGSKTSQGRANIRSMRLAMWSSIASREHTVAKIFPFGVSAREYMLYGTVKFDFKNGHQGKQDWASRAHLSTHNGAWRMSLYQVYLDTGAEIYSKG